MKKLTIKNIYKKININPFFYFFGLVSIFTGFYKPFLILYLIIAIHEFGHILMAILFKYKIIKVNIYPFGGYTIFENDINVPFIKEFMVFLGGILFQTIFLLLINNIVNTNSYFYRIYSNYNKNILFFNMLPILPLDGGKLLNMILNHIFPYKSSYIKSIKISYLIIILLVIYYHTNINLMLMIVLLIGLLVKEYKNIKYLFNRFLLERCIRKIKYRKNNFILNKKIEKMKKYKNNIFILNNQYIDEKEVLKKYFKI